MPFSFWDHLDELRNRLLKAVLAVAGTTFFSFFFANHLLGWLVKPSPLGPDGLTALKPAAVFVESLRLSLVAGLLLALPVVLYQAWAFIRPGLSAKEGRAFVLSFYAGALLFIAGSLFAYYLVIPATLNFFWMYGEHLGVQQAWTIDHYISFVLMFLLSFGLAFELPVILVLLVWLNIVRTEQLRAKRPYIIVGLAILAALLTPPDAVSQVLLILPLWLLFEISLFVSKRL
ncbi:MAG: twin-arginine translocase subunit TatC [Deltaproteobacteria bacterium]|nr:twin-arginine translocase subunit TatC [Deltaproteobacteria bacterium]